MALNSPTHGRRDGGSVRTIGVVVIVTVTPNPAFDASLPLPGTDPGSSHRIEAMLERAGGKGLNVAGILACLGRDVVAAGPVGGTRANEFVQDARARGITAAFTPSPVATRRTVAVLEPDRDTLFIESGLPQPTSVWNDLVGEIAQLVRLGDVLAVSGSLPPTTSEDLIARLCERAHAVDALTILDTCGVPLLNALDYHPTVVSINEREAVSVVDSSDPVRAAHALVNLGARSAVISCGAAGLVAVAPGVPTLSAALTKPIRGNPTGAGDAVTAALAACFDLADGADVESPSWWRDTLRKAVSWSAACVLQPGAGFVEVADVDRLNATIKIEEIS